MSEELIINIPSGWAHIQFGEAITLKRGFDLPKKNRLEGNVPIYAANGPVGTHNITKVKGPGVVTGRSGTIGKVHFVEEDFWPLNTALFVEDFHGSDPKFVAYLLRHISLEQFSSSTAVPTLNRNIVHESFISLPPLNEQHRIVAKIEALTARSRKARAALDAIPALLDQFRQSVLAAAFRGDLTADWRAQNPDVEPAEMLLEQIRTERRARWEVAELEKMKAKGKVPKNDKWKKKYPEPEPLDNSVLPDLPEHWCWVKWEDIGLCQNGRAFPSKEYSSTGTKLLRPGNLHISGKLEWTESNTRYMPEKWEKDFPNYVIGPNELVINLTAQSLADEFLGRVCLTADKEHCLLNQRIARLTPAIISTRFCLWLFKSAFFRKYVDELNTGSLIQHMFVSQIDQFVFPLPPLKEQVAIVKIVEAQVTRIEKIQILRQRMDEEIPALDQSILAKAFRGELVPQAPNDEPASVLLERIRTEREKTQKKKRKGKGKK